MEQDQASICGLPGGSLDVKSVDRPWASTVGEIAIVSQVLTCGVRMCTDETEHQSSVFEDGGFVGVSALGQHCFPGEKAFSSQSLKTLNTGTHCFSALSKRII